MNLAQYFTNSTISEFLVSQFQFSKPESILDIGCGELSLLRAAGRRWDDAKLIGYDIDPYASFNVDGNKFKFNIGDGLDPSLSTKIEDMFGKIDVAVSNPPYVSVDLNVKTRAILKKAHMLDVLSSCTNKIPAEIIFLAQNLLVLKDQSELGIILPSGIISGERWKGIREFLINEYSIKSCTQIPSNAFKNTEVSTFALCLKNVKDTPSKVNLQDLSCTKPIEIGVEDAISRMDYSYYKYAEREFSQSFCEFPVESIFRGNMPYNQLLNAGLNCVHTTSIKDPLQTVFFDNCSVPMGVKYAMEGDILISRVGTRCLGRSAFVRAGKIAISDCIFVIRSKHNEKIWEIIESCDFRTKLQHIALGSGAKYLTINLLKEIFHVG